MNRSCILHIDTTGNRGLVMLSQQGQPVACLENNHPMEHGSFLHPAIAQLMQEQQVTAQNLLAIAIANGPGSYTGLRVGLAAAKGLCYAWNIPLITLSSLKLLALAANQKEQELGNKASGLIVSMIDARRMEVFYAIYDASTMKTILEPQTAILNSSFLEKELKDNRIIFVGNGVSKWASICPVANTCFMDQLITDITFAQEADQLFSKNKFADLAYTLPAYTKEFYQQISIKK